MITISIIIVNYNTSEVLDSCLSSIQASDCDDLEVFVVDNNSMDFNLDKYEERYPFVKFIVNQLNVGFAKANNQAYKLSKGSYVLLLNPDVEINSGALNVMLDYLETHKDAGAVGPKLIDDLKNEANQGYYNKLPKWSGVFSYYFRRKDKPITLPNRETEVEQIPGACMMVQRKTIDDIGFLDEKYFVWMEDVDFCLRMKKHGWKMTYLPQAVVKHIGGMSFKKMKAGKKGLIWAKSNILYFFKNEGVLAGSIFTVLFLPKIIQYLSLWILGK